MTESMNMKENRKEKNDAGILPSLLIRKAGERDLQELTDIYNEEVVNGTASLDLKAVSAEERALWMADHNQANHPLYVAQVGDRVAGYVSLSVFNRKRGYDGTTELSVYVARDFRRQGIARKLVSFILDWARENKETHTVVSIITGGNTASIQLHEKLGFSLCGTIREAGYKFGSYVDVAYYQIMV